MHKLLLSIILRALLTILCAFPPIVQDAKGQETGVTFYKIQSRWYPNEFLYEDNGALRYGTGNGATYLWSVEPVGDAVRIRNKSTGHWLHIKDGVSAVTCENVAKEETQGYWILNVVAGTWQSLQSKSNNRFLNIERRANIVECHMPDAPTDKTLWSAQWNLVHAEGPPPPPVYRRNMVAVLSPVYGSDVEGATTIQIKAPGLKSASVRCWKDEGDSLVATVDLDEQGNGSFVFPAGQYPHGPLTVRITGTNGAAQNAIKDNCYLQLWNKGGFITKEKRRIAPPQAAGMKLLYADEFTRPLSISRTGAGATYASHKPGGGDFSGIPFGDHESPETPFSQREGYLRIRADEKKNTTGLISSLRFDGTGIVASAPCYFECRFLAQSAPGTWPAFWVMTKGVYKGLKEPADELDVIEAYGGEGPGNPNQRGYWIASHYWNQGPNGDKDKSQPGVYEQIPMTELKGASGASWFENFHTYGVKITPEDTIYYCDDIEVKRHKTAKLSRQEPFFFFVNLAIGGTSGWAKDLSRYGGIADMYVDYVRVYGAG